MALLLTQLKDKYISFRGFHTNRRLVVIESDDWGSIRMPSRTTFEALQALGDHPEKDAFLSNDSLESEADLQALYSVLGSVTDAKGNPAVITTNFAMANPDFDRIDPQAGQYAYEPFYKTYDRYYGQNNILSVIKEGMSKGYIFPQLHCREHMNVSRWMYDLQHKKANTLMAFEHRMIGVGASFYSENLFGYMDAFHTDRTKDEELEKIVTEAAEIFEDTFGYRSETFVASCFVWGDSFEVALKKLGIRFIQSAPWQLVPQSSHGEYKLKRRIRFTGQENSIGQRYSVRNCEYEPAYNQNPTESAQECFSQIERSFKAKKPAIITSHRLNYIGSIRPENRENNLIGLKTLLDSIVKAYPDVEFVSSADLFSIMIQEQK